LASSNRNRFTRLGGGPVVYRTDWIAIRECPIERDGVPDTYAVLERADAVVVIPVTPSRRTIVLKQFRFPIDASSWELPMGAAADGEPAESAARRELLEEVGVRAVELVAIGGYRPAPGLSSQRAAVFVAPVEDAALDEAIRSWAPSEEIQEAAAVAVADLDSLIADGRMTDGYSLAALLLLRSWMGAPGATHD